MDLLLVFPGRIMWLLVISFILATDVGADVVLTQSGDDVKKPGESHRLSCQGSGFTFGSYHMSWVRQAPGKGLEFVAYIYTDSSGKFYSAAVQGRFTVSRDNPSSAMYLDMGSLKTEDSATYYCARSVYNALDYWGQGTSLLVTAAQPSKPSVFPLVPCCKNKSDTNVDIGCLVTGFLPQPVEVTWNAGSSITSGAKTYPAVLRSNTGLYSQSSHLSVPASEWKTKTYKCLVKHTPTSSEVTVTVKNAECKTTTSKPTVKLLQSSCKDNSVTEVIELVCLISGFSPDNIQVQWLVNGEPGSLIPYTAPSQKDQQGIFSTSSRLNVTKSSWMLKDIYTCKVDHPASKSASTDSIRNCIEISNPMQPSVSLIGPSVKDLYISKATSIICRVTKMETLDQLSINWQRENEKPIAGDTKESEYDESSGTFSAESILKITPQDWDKMVVFTCIVTHADFSYPVKKTISKLKETGSAPTAYVFAPHQQELARHDFVSLTCLVMGFRPMDIHVQWEHNGSVISGKDSVSTMPVMESSGTYFLYSKLTIQKSHWERRHTFTCTAVHSALPANNMMKRDIQKSNRK